MSNQADRAQRRGGAQQRLDVQVVRREDDLEEHLLVDGDEFLVPLADVRCPLAVLVLRLVRGRELLAPMVLAVLKDLIRHSGRSTSRHNANLTRRANIPSS